MLLCCGALLRAHPKRPHPLLTARYSIPTIYPYKSYVDAGGLMSYGADGPALFRLSAKFVHRILRGEQPNDLPVEQPTKFELAVNLKSAKTIGLIVPEAFLARADALLE